MWLKNPKVKKMQSQVGANGENRNAKTGTTRTRGDRKYDAAAEKNTNALSTSHSLGGITDTSNSAV